MAAAIESQQPQPASVVSPPAIRPQQTTTAIRMAQPDATACSTGSSASPAHSLRLPPGQVALVSGIRHWSTPVYTRIAIDLQNQVAYQAARVPGPDRIYFDLHGARLDRR